MRREATISADGLYRHDLTRSVQPGCRCERCAAYYARPVNECRAGYVLFALCNPSTASAETDDATERRGWGFTLTWGYSKFVFVNTDPWRSTDPKAVRKTTALAMQQNDLYLIEHAKHAALIICAWGTNANSSLAQRAEHCLRWAARGKSLHALELTKHGIPKHPLYLNGSLTPQVYLP